MRWFLIFTTAIVLMVCSGIRHSSADIEIWYELEPIGTMGSPVILNVDWPNEPPKGIDFRNGISIGASADDHDHGDAYAVDTDTWEWEWLGSFSVPGSPEMTWTCSWGVFEETNSNEAIGEDDFVYYNTVFVEDNLGNPYEGLEVTQDILTGFPTNTHADGLTGAEVGWLANDANGTTDETGFIRDFDRVENMATEQEVEMDSTHIAKMAWIPQRPACKTIYWNPLPICTGQHANQLVLPPP